MAALQLAQYLVAVKAFDSEAQFDDVNARFLADIVRVLVQGYVRFQHDLSFLAFYLNWYALFFHDEDFIVGNFIR